MKDEEKDMMTKTYYTQMKKHPWFFNRVFIAILALIAIFLVACFYYSQKS